LGEVADMLEVARLSADVSGRREALGGLAARTARRGHAIARDLLGDAAEAEDAVQESLARACASWERLREPEALDGWFFRVLTNVCLRSLRRRRLGQVLRRFWSGDAVVRGAGDADDEAGESWDLVDAQAARPDEGLDARRVLDAVGELPVMQRAALVLRYGHDCAVGEIATMLGVGEGTVKTHLVRGLKRLRERVGADESRRAR
jgi:RNA polymerase sigma-70 factor (ECF subfamily)